jgi:hypothetical protein
MTTGVQCRVDPDCTTPAPADTEVCKCHQEQMQDHGLHVFTLPWAERIRSNWAPERHAPEHDKEAGS